MKKNVEKGWNAKYTFDRIIGQSEEIQRAKLLAKRYAKSNRNILIIGETGTGKELFAQSIGTRAISKNPWLYIQNVNTIY